MTQAISPFWLVESEHTRALEEEIRRLRADLAECQQQHTAPVSPKGEKGGEVDPDALAALRALGFTKGAATQALQATTGATTEERVRAALQQL